jgi:hypothetical protein
MTENATRTGFRGHVQGFERRKAAAHIAVYLQRKEIHYFVVK